MTNIHPTAIVSPKARLCENLTVGPYAIIHDDVEIGNNCSIGPHAVIYDGARIGNNVRIYQGASISHVPQDLKFDGGPTEFIIGDNTTIHEYVTLHRGTHETGKSVIGKNCLFMAYTHIAHDCRVGDNCIIANGVQVGGHAVIEDWVTIGGMTPVHQFCKIGQHSMIGGGFRVVQDIPPFILAGNEPLTYSGLNIIGLRRRGFSNEDINILKLAYTYIYNSGLNFSKGKEKVQQELGYHPLVQKILEFMSKSKRGIINK
ncbi:MAG: acyl-ACP--UDP-N-acetylglucosamine O-acyltransferase [Bacteroidota bacterium]|nr:acyl-ACP--UDP-N-acetylglucosamine O-acyltransferase [Bacteroidota bacterium]MDP4194753.1 acyl-ACP--UDP-N-acetylglucosamine O-acyltransferase [Bacteroidota bacterium]